MITRIQSLNYRCLRHVDQRMSNFHVLVGPNASGKTTFLDVIAFLGQLVTEGLDEAVGNRTQNFQDLLWRRQGTGFELAIEAAIPNAVRQRLGNAEYDTVRYEVAVALDPQTLEIGLTAERVLLKQSEINGDRQRDFFPQLVGAPASILFPKTAKGTQPVIKKVPGGNDNYYAETAKGYNPSFKLGERKSALGNLPADEKTFPVSTWLRQFLTEGVQSFVLNSLLIRKASPPGQVRRFKPDGSNLPWVVDYLRSANAERFGDWLKHVRTALPDLENVRVVEREDDKHRYLVLCYEGGLEVPSWMASDGTLRLLALTLPAYLTDFEGTFLIEEPENGIHPKAVEAVYQSLSSVYGAQVLMATHSPVMLSLVETDHVLCFAKDEQGATDIVVGSKHPALAEWHGEPNLNVLFAAGVLS
jgi:predicted ATPase